MRSLAWWAAVIVPVWLLCVLCTYWEPILRDSWAHVWWHHATDVGVIEFAKDSYLHNNPRLGQAITWLLLTPGPWHVIVTPVVELAMFYVLCVLVLGRSPSLRRTDDALLFATVVAMFAASCPQIGSMLFYRPFTGNYLYGLVISLLVLVPYRLDLEKPVSSRWLAPVMFVGGLAAGLSNEHTDPAIAALCIVATIVAWRRRSLRAWMIAGVVGVLVGSAMLYFAPGQAFRYDGLATKQSVVQRIVSRGTGNFAVIGTSLRYLRPLLLWLVPASILAIVARRRVPRITWGLGATALAITLTLLASPKQGPRLHLATVAFGCAAAAAFVHAQLERTWQRLVTILLAIVMAGWTGYRLLSIYARIGPQAHERIAAILHAEPGSTLHLAPYPFPHTRYFMGDDLYLEKYRRYVAESFNLAKIELVEDAQRRANVPPEDEP